jgi:diamine N-acetyltransferase
VGEVHPKDARLACGDSSPGVPPQLGGSTVHRARRDRKDDVAIALREITRANLRDIVELKVAPEQERFVTANAVSIAEAYFDRDVAWFRAIYADETPVGFVMLYDAPVERKYYLWRFMIDHRFQRQGYGTEALNRVIAYVRERPGALEFLTCVGRGEGSPGPFYEKLGFVYTGRIVEGERVMRKEL